MSDRGQHEPSLVDRIRRWLWLDGTQRTDASEANRGFYPGLTRKPVGWRFFVLVGSLAILIGLVIISVRDTEAQATEPSPSALVVTVSSPLQAR